MSKVIMNANNVSKKAKVAKRVSKNARVTKKTKNARVTKKTKNARPHYVAMTTPIHVACLSGDLITIEELHDNYLQALHYAFEDGDDDDVALVQNLKNPLTELDEHNEWKDDLIIGSTSRKQTSRGHFPLHSAVKGGNPDIVKYILDNLVNDYADQEEVDINCKDSNGMSPLYYAYYFGHQSCADLLISAGADRKHVIIM
jgi:ankyrin repeat protein